jgi:hypothetical protein
MSALCSGCTASTTKLGYNGGGGFRRQLNGFSMFLEARFHYIPGASDPTTAGIKSSTRFVPISIGMIF